MIYFYDAASEIRCLHIFFNCEFCWLVVEIWLSCGFKCYRSSVLSSQSWDGLKIFSKDKTISYWYVINRINSINRDSNQESSSVNLCRLKPTAFFFFNNDLSLPLCLDASGVFVPDDTTAIRLVWNIVLMGVCNDAT